MARRLFCEISPLTYRISLAKGIWLRRFKNWRSNEQFATYHKEKKLGVLVNGKLVAGVGGGLCNLANTLHLLVMNSPMTVTELHHHSDALAPDPDGVHVPYSAGTSVNYNFIDFRFRNDTYQPVQFRTWVEGDELFTELRSDKEFPTTYRLVEEDHHFHKEENGKYYRYSKIYRETLDRATGAVLKRELNWDNRSEVMFDYSLIPTDQIR